MSNGLRDFLNPKLWAEGVMAKQTMRNAASSGFVPHNPNAYYKKQADDDATRAALRKGGVMSKRDRLYP